MARVLVRYRPSSPGSREVLRSHGVQADMERRAIRVANAVRGRSPAVLSHGREGVVGDSYRGRGRAGSTTIGVPLDYERDHRTLGGAIDAARD